MSQSLERRLTVLERINLRLHLYVCAWCARYLKQLSLIREVARASDGDVGEGPGLSELMRARIAENLNQK